jgi:hypothetical protein
MEADPLFADVFTMRISPRIAALAPPRAAGTPLTRGARAGVLARARAPAGARVLASALAGALAGLAAGAVIAAVAPGVGRTASVQALPATARDDESGLHRGAAASPVSAVLAPAIEVGVVPAPDPGAARP